jgi:hypothetical protein
VLHVDVDVVHDPDPSPPKWPPTCLATDHKVSSHVSLSLAPTTHLRCGARHLLVEVRVPDFWERVHLREPPTPSIHVRIKEEGRENGGLLATHVVRVREVAQAAQIRVDLRHQALLTRAQPRLTHALLYVGWIVARVLDKLDEPVWTPTLQQRV